MFELFILLILFTEVRLINGIVQCPPNDKGHVLTCAYGCCKSLDATFEDYFCCGDGSNRQTSKAAGIESQRFVAYGTTFQVDYTLLIVGLIISILLSVLFSFLCCLLCNGCWLHRRRNPQMYESVNESGFYPLCCGFGIPVGTIVLSTHPVNLRDDNELYHGSSSNTSSFGNRSRVRFDENDKPRGVLKGNPS